MTRRLAELGVDIDEPDRARRALHRVTGEPILFKGEDFAAAGVPRAK